MNRIAPTPDTRRGPYWRPLVLLTAVLGLSMLFASSSAHAQADTASCTFFEIQASKNGKGVDPKLKKLKKKLLRPMFSEWSKFDLLAKHETSLKLTETKLINIASGAKLSAMYKEYSKAKKERFKLRLSVLWKNGKRGLGTDFTVYAGDYLLISMRTKDKNKSYILGATCKK